MVKTKQTTRKWKEPAKGTLKFFASHFSSPPLRKRYSEQFMTRSIIPSYFIKLEFLNHLAINHKTLRKLLGVMGLKNLLTLRELIYSSLIKVFYSNMLISSNTSNKIFTNVSGVQIAFDVRELNRILRIPNEEFQVFTSRQ